MGLRPVKPDENTGLFVAFVGRALACGGLQSARRVAGRLALALGVHSAVGFRPCGAGWNPAAGWHPAPTAPVTEPRPRGSGAFTAVGTRQSRESAQPPYTRP